MTLTTLITSVGVLAALQAAYVYLKGMEARSAGAPAMFSTVGDDYFDESDEEKTAGELKQKFDMARAKAIMAMAEQFAEKHSKN